MIMSKSIKGLVALIVLVLSFFIGYVVGVKLVVFCCFVFNINIPKPLESNLGFYVLMIFIPIVSAFVFMKAGWFLIKKFLVAK